MHILILPSWYQNKQNAMAGVFFKEQAEALVKYNNKVGIIAIQEIGIKNTLEQRKLDFSNKKFIENEVLTYILQYPAIPKLHKTGKIIKKLLFARLFKQYVKVKGMPDIVHLHSYINGELALWIKEKYNTPYVVTEHLSGFARETTSAHNLIKARSIFEKSDYNIAVSKQFKELLQDKFNADFNYIPNIVNINFFNLKDSAEKGIFSFINIAFLNKNKNQDMLIRAFSKAFKNKTSIKLTIVGDGSEYNNLKLLIEELNLEKQVRLYGRATREEIRGLLHDSDAFVLSSLYETFGVVVIEAMACGLPVVATKCGGPESIINSDRIGLLSKINENDLAEKLLKMYNRRFDFDSHFIRRYVELNFSEKAVCLKLNDVYKSKIK